MLYSQIQQCKLLISVNQPSMGYMNFAFAKIPSVANNRSYFTPYKEVYEIVIGTSMPTENVKG